MWLIFSAASCLIDKRNVIENYVVHHPTNLSFLGIFKLFINCVSNRSVVLNLVSVLIKNFQNKITKIILVKTWEIQQFLPEFFIIGYHFHMSVQHPVSSEQVKNFQWLKVYDKVIHLSDTVNVSFLFEKFFDLCNS